MIRRAMNRVAGEVAGDDTSNARVAVLGINYPPELTGIAPYTGALAAALARAGHHVTAHVAHPHYPGWSLAPGYGQWTLSEDLDGVRVIRRRHYVPRSPRGIRRLASELSFGVRLVFGRWGSPHIVVAVSPSLFSTALASLRVLLTPRRYRPALVVWVQDIYTVGLAETGEGGKFVRSVVKRVEGLTLKVADRVVVIHERFGEIIEGQFRVNPAKIVVFRNWTHLPPAEPVSVASARAALGWPADVVLAVHTGNMGSKQGLENLIEAARLSAQRNEAVHFVLVGDGGERQQLQELAEGLNNVKFVEPLDDQMYRLALAAADVLIVNEKPGVSAMAVPSKLTSYFDAGRPVIAATDLGGITAAEVTAAAAGISVPAGDPGALLDTVIAVVGDPQAAAQLGQNGRRYRELVLNEQHALRVWVSFIRAATDDSCRQKAARRRIGFA